MTLWILWEGIFSYSKTSLHRQLWDHEESGVIKRMAVKESWTREAIHVGQHDELIYAVISPYPFVAKQHGTCENGDVSLFAFDIFFPSGWKMIGYVLLGFARPFGWKSAYFAFFFHGQRESWTFLCHYDWSRYTTTTLRYREMRMLIGSPLWYYQWALHISLCQVG